VDGRQGRGHDLPYVQAQGRLYKPEGVNALENVTSSFGVTDNKSAYAQRRIKALGIDPQAEESNRLQAEQIKQQAALIALLTAKTADANREVQKAVKDDFDWIEGPEPVALQITGTCSDHAHFELLGIDGESVAGGILTRRQCVALANLLINTIDLIDTTDGYVEHGIAELERYVQG
jgi:hypothetical protein